MSHTKTILKAMKALGISRKQKTDPVMVQQVLREMHLDDFQTSFAPMGKFLRDATTKKQDLSEMIDCTVKAIEERHPAIVEFVEIGLKKGWFKKGPRVSRSLHTWYVREVFTAAMANNHEFLLEVSEHLTNKAKLDGIDCHRFFRTLYVALSKTHNLFSAAKGFSADALLTFYRQQRGMEDSKLSKKKVQQLFKKGKIDFLDRQLLMPSLKKSSRHFSDWVRVNIYEAGITDHVHGFKGNAITAEALNADLKNKRYKETTHKKKVLPDGYETAFYASLASGGSAFPSIEFSQEWVSLYITWNAAFVAGNLDELDIILPKLFLPSVVACKPSNFIGVRIISLWLSVTHSCFDTLERKAKPLVSKKLQKEMGKAWGAINEKYADALLKKDLNMEPQELKEESELFYAHPFFNIARVLSSFWN